MPVCFADTAHYLALLNARDALHWTAIEASRRVSGSVVTSSWVIQELADGLATPPSRSVFLRLLDALRNDPDLLIVGFDATLWRKALDLYRDRPDKAWSLTDCTSFVIMQEHHIREALTADSHFEQAGFTVLLKTPP
jgi:hypothetical protein